MAVSHRFLVEIPNKPVRRVAFYDRASGTHQQRNYARSVNCDVAKEYADRHQWEIVPSGDARNQGVCWLDCGTGTRSDNRPAFLAILSDDRVDTIAAVQSDRLARGVEPTEALMELCEKAGKNLVVLLAQHTMDFENRLMTMIELAWARMEIDDV